MTMPLFILLPFMLFGLIRTQICQPIYWQVDPNYNLISNEIQTYSDTQIINIPNLNVTTGIVFNKTNYYIQNITTIIKYDNSNKQVIINQNNLSVSGIVLNFQFMFDALVNGTKNYSGTGIASLSNVSISYSKQFKIVNGNLVYNLASADISPINNIIIEEFNPNLNDTTSQQKFYKLLNYDLYNELTTLIQLSYIIKLNQLFQKQNIINTFGTQAYNYTFQTYNKVFNTTIQSLLFTNGVIIGYDASIIGVDHDCSQYVPTQPIKSSIITYQFIKNLWLDYAASLTNVVVDGTNTKSDLFQFYLIDLQDIIPNAVQKFTKLLSKLSASCSVDISSTSIQIDPAADGLIANVNWICNLNHLDSETIFINFQSNLKYKIKITQLSNKFIVNINRVQFSSVQWQISQQYPLVNSQLAQQYLVSLLPSFNQIQTVGTNFIQPTRKIPKFIFQSDAIIIADINPQLYKLD